IFVSNEMCPITFSEAYLIAAASVSLKHGLAQNKNPYKLYFTYIIKENVQKYNIREEMRDAIFQIPCVEDLFELFADTRDIIIKYPLHAAKHEYIKDMQRRQHNINVVFKLEEIVDFLIKQQIIVV